MTQEVNVDVTKYPLDTDDIAILLDALKAWEHKDQAGDMLITLLGAAYKPKDGMEAEKWDRSEAERLQKTEREKAVRQEQSIVLQAKLIQLRNRLTADNFVASALGVK